MKVNSRKGAKPRHGSSRKSSQPTLETQKPALSPRAKAIVEEAEKVEQLMGEIYSTAPDDADSRNTLLEQHVKLKHLNSFGKQLLIRMFRSSDRFWGYKIDLDSHILKPGVLFLAGTLCEDFDYLHTSPMFGLSVLDVGCGALSEYAPPDQEQDLLTQFYSDRPPIGAELLQMLGAKIVGIDPREHAPNAYSYQVAYKHLCVDFADLKSWFQVTQQKFDVISCINLFNRQGFLYDHQTPEAIAQFFNDLKWGLLPNGLIYTSPPVTPSSQENRCANRRIFTKAGLKIIYEGYFLILTAT